MHVGQLFLVAALTCLSGAALGCGGRTIVDSSTSPAAAAGANGAGGTGIGADAGTVGAGGDPGTGGGGVASAGGALGGAASAGAAAGSGTALGDTCPGERTAPFDWVLSLGDGLSAAVSASGSSGQDLFVLVGAPVEATNVLLGCEPIEVESGPANRGMILARFGVDGACGWSRRLADNTSEAPAPALLAVSNNLVLAGQQGIAVTFDGDLAWNAPVVAGVTVEQCLPAHDGFVCSGPVSAELSPTGGLAIVRLSSDGKVTSTWTAAFEETPSESPRFVRAVDLIGSLFVAGTTTVSIPALGVSAPKGGTTAFAAQLGPDNQLQWSDILPGASLTPDWIAFAPDGSSLQIGGPAVVNGAPATRVLTRSPDGGWSETARQGVVLNSATLGPGGIGAGVQSPVQNVLHASIALRSLPECGWGAEVVPSTTGFLGVYGIGRLGSGYAISGLFGGPNPKSCDSGTAMFGKTTLATSCIGSFLAHVAP